MTNGHWAPLSIAIILSLASCKAGTTVGVVPCASNSNCSATQYCAAGSCYPKVPTGTCGDGADHAANDVCSSGLCLTGACCTSNCADTDPTCKATSCDPASGACVYPTSTATCGPPESCASGSHTAASSCNGQGACTLAQATPCASHTCFNTQRCVATCTDNSGCAATEYCASGECAPKLPAGSVCGPTPTSTAPSACASGACLGTHCCSAPCDTSDPQCGATSCDMSGACFYPDQQTKCGALQGCAGSTYTPQSQCNGQGACATAPTHDCEPYVCDEPGAICNSACTADGGQCAADAYCAGKRCTPKEPLGQLCAATSTSAADEACISGICSGTCCATNCPPDPAAYNCLGLCDTQGACIPKTCPNNFSCAGTTDCKTTCATNLDCFPTAFCDPAGANTCCSRFNPGDALYIDGAYGNDANICCGAQATPCQTITHAMAMIAASATSGPILQVSNGDGSTSWTPNEVYPIHLGWGVTLNAPNIYFVNQTQASDLFQVYAYGATDVDTVIIQGGNTDFLSDAVFIGFDPAQGDFEVGYHHAEVAVNDAVAGKTALPMVLSEAWLTANDGTNQNTAYALRVGAGAKITLGPNPVEIGDGELVGVPYSNAGPEGDHGIFCTGAGASIQDDPTATVPVLSIERQHRSFLDIEDGCVVSLTRGPQLGAFRTISLGQQHIVKCPLIAAEGSVKVVGGGQVTFGSSDMPGTVRCGRYGFDAETSDASGSPQVMVNGATIDLMGSVTTSGGVTTSSGIACAGAMVTEGSFSAVGTTFQHARMGIFVGSNALSVDLSGGGNGGNIFGCNSSAWGMASAGGVTLCDATTNGVPLAGADVVNATNGLGVSVQNATWDSWSSTDNSTQIWSCSDTSYSDCTCTGPNCSAYTSPGTPPDGADAIYLSTNTAATPLDTSVGSQSSVVCQ